ncbi:hypothetical protein BW14_05980 [Bifidobacterium sp. UTBIF-68]|uniref:hypothetical protein n=1 Tax=Bifidobacterium sp. UTBIF-68 TaxID=1465262 RepID=UPI00112D8AEC|nr:hypothetical protein [Bifidobacterium sp. UTBIF-68]TPF93222.1 hypothetical protein BW14_05980 [Bifidobacterium sp. UTBIF-68]
MMDAHPIAWGAIIWLPMLLLAFTLMGIWAGHPSHARFYRHCAAAAALLLAVLVPVFTLEGFIPWIS